MKSLLTLLSLLILTAAHGAETPADGLYVIAPGAPAPQIRSQDGTMVFLGGKQEFKVKGGDLLSSNNANSSFDLNIELPYDQMLAPNHILVVAGTAYRQLGISSCNGAADSCSLYFRIQQDSNARQVAGYLGIPATYHRHPGHRLLTSFTPTKPSFARGEEVNVVLRIVNVGTERFAFTDDVHQCPQFRSILYAFSASRNSQPVPDVRNRPGDVVCTITVLLPHITLQAGAAFEDTLNLGNWFAFKESGTYLIRGSFPLNFKDPDAPSRRSVPSIWADYATAEFTVTIE